jgi:hypothetical protein
MPWYDEKTFVLRVDDIEKMRAFLEALGLTFVREKHGSGPEHYSCERNGRVLEIYPKAVTGGGHDAV